MLLRIDLRSKMTHTVFPGILGIQIVEKSHKPVDWDLEEKRLEKSLGGKL